MRDHCYRYSLPVLCIIVVAFVLQAILLPAQTPTAVGKLPIAELQKQADAGDPAAQNELGLRYRLGTDVEKDPAKAVPWFLKAARQGYPKAYFNLGAAYFNGDGVRVSDQNSCVWFMLAADAGDARGEEAVERVRQEGPPRQLVDCEVLTATAYLNGTTIKQNYSKAMEWYVKAARAGDGLACDRIAYLYDRGLGVPQDKQQSFDWLKKGADLNYDVSLFELGRAYERGVPVPQDLNKARTLYEQAAAYGQPNALTALGSMYAEGRGVKADNQKAFTYYILASHYGDAEGETKADDLATKLSEKQIAAAKKDAVKAESNLVHPLVLLKR
jgi:hypothetical protein